MALQIPFDNSYARLPERFFAPRAPTPVRLPQRIRVNVGLAQLLGIDPEALASDAGVQVLAGNIVPEGAQPIALAYAGHQFGNFVPQLGDGRAILMGEVVASDGKRYDLQWKGSGRTPFSRGGDGRAALGPVLREYVVSEAMHALGVPTARSLGAVTTGEYVVREQPLPGAIVMRVAASHLRVGTFQFFAARQDTEALRILADYAIERHFPDALDSENRYVALLEGVVAKQAALVAGWMAVGFIHGVMNTDNTTISGETIDFGPCAFMDEFHPGMVFSSIDRTGRYAYGNQPRIASWNLARLAESLMPLLGADEHASRKAAQDALGLFGAHYERAHLEAMSAKLGLVDAREGDSELVQSLLGLMADTSADFTNTFRALAAVAEDPSDPGTFRAQFGSHRGVEDWLGRFRVRLAAEAGSANERAAGMRAVSPAYIPRNHQVEAAIQAGLAGDFGPFGALCDVLASPFEERPGLERYAAPPQEHERVRQTFCGT